MIPRSLGHRAPMFWLVLPFMAGLAAGKAGELTPALWLLAGALGAVGVAVWASWRAPRCWAPVLCAAMFLAGTASYALHRQRLPEWNQLPPREAYLALRIDRVFPQAGAPKAVGLATVARADGPVSEVVGQRIYFSLQLRKDQAPPVRSTVIAAVGVLAPLPRDPPADGFDNYLANAGVNFRFARGRVLEIEQPPTAYRRFCDRAAARLNKLLGAGVATRQPALTAVFRAMMLGQKHELSDEQDTLFMHSGTMHLFAINGLHIGVVALALHAVLALLRCPRPVAALLTLGVLWLDVDTTGASPSAVRAFMLVAAYEAGFVLRRPANGLAALGTAALAVLLIEPLALFSASFQMSYGVVLTILCFGVPLGEWLAARWRPFALLPEATWKWWQHWLTRGLWWLAGALGIGTAASLVSAVTGPTFFHVFTPGALAINLVLVPLAMLVIIAGVASVVTGLAGLVWLNSLFNHAAMLVLLCIDRLIRLGLRAPGLWWPAQWRAPWVGTLALGALLTAGLAGYAWRWEARRGGWWPPVAVVALALLFGIKWG